MVEEYIPLKSFTFLQDAYILAGRLKSDGIDTQIFDEHTLTIDPFYSQAIGGAKVAVRKSDFPLAKQILNSIEKENEPTYKNVFARPFTRLGARLIDSIIMTLAAFLITSLLTLAGFDTAPWPLIVFVISFLVLDILIYMPMGDLRGYTIGKKNMGLKIRSQKTKLRPTGTQAFLRSISKFFLVGFPVIGLMWGLMNQNVMIMIVAGVVWVLPHLYTFNNRKNQTLYDRIAGVIIIEKKAIPKVEEEE